MWGSYHEVHRILISDGNPKDNAKFANIHKAEFRANKSHENSIAGISRE